MGQAQRNIYGLIMAGGSGTRFWPESTQARPKQYLRLFSDKTLLEETLNRLKGLVHKDHTFIVTTQDQQTLAMEHSYGHLDPHQNIILEPSARNTAPCILLSLVTLSLRGASDDDIVCILPADHVILNTRGFQANLQAAADIASSSSKIVTIGVPPHFPHTGYGYIQKGVALPEDARTFTVERFKEKPDFQTAKDYLASGNYLWNAGMFISTIGVLRREMELHAPQVAQHSRGLECGIAAASQDKEILKAVYNGIPSISIDYAVMEKSRLVVVKEAEFDWNDLGSWDALESVCRPVDGNYLLPTGAKHYFHNAQKNIVYGQEGQFVALINVDDLIVVSSKKALMVLPKKDAQKIKEVVEHLKKNGEIDYL